MDDSFAIPGNVTGTALVFSPAGDGSLVMTVAHENAAGHNSVILRPEWLRPLAAWFAGEAESVRRGEPLHVPYSRQLCVADDEEAMVWSTHTWARLRCRLPFGTALVTAGPRGRYFGWAVMLSPGARQDAAAFLRRADAAHWAVPAA